LQEQAPPDSPQIVNVVATYAGHRNGRDVLALVFDSSTATMQVTGRTISQLPAANIVRVANVVVLLQGWHSVDQRALITALRHARGG
jgi:hypothetical protein